MLKSSSGAVTGLAVLICIVLASCAPSSRELPSPATVSTYALAAQAVDHLRSVSGVEVQIDCGSSVVDFSVGTQASCVGTEAGADQSIPILIEITAVEGQNFTVSVESNWPAGP